ncbi:MAG TPA: hypothetical protein VKX24_13335 [Acidimicrobiia bacterium]|nr:hypothetical protein [Acidimicrobiia bacterium]HZQ79701.1 hypothetical protein [Acidimicrobiia bacterium]
MAEMTSEQTEGTTAEKEQPQQEMCCDGKQTAEEHRHSSPDGKCCIDK